MTSLLELFSSPELKPVLIYLVTLVGSVTMYLFSLSKGFAGSAESLKKLFPKKKQVFYDRLDFVIVVILGSIIGYSFFSPDSSPEALAAGVGWVGVVNVLAAKNDIKIGEQS